VSNRSLTSCNNHRHISIRLHLCCGVLSKLYHLKRLRRNSPKKDSLPRKIHLGPMKIISIQIFRNRGNYFIHCGAKVTLKSTSSHHDTASTYKSHNAQMTSSSQRMLQQNTLHSLVHNELPAVITYSSQTRKIVLKNTYCYPIASLLF